MRGATRVIVAMIGVVALLAGSGSLSVPAAGAAARTSVKSAVSAAPGWCGGTDETVVDRPDVGSDPQIHVVYARAADVPDHFALDAPRIVRDLAGVDAWWRRQDPTRTPRFDFAPFLYCNSQFGNLDISSVQLPGTNANYHALGSTDFVTQIGTDLANAILPPYGEPGAPAARGVAATKKYLVYLDVAGPLVDKCGVTAGENSLTGPRWPALVFLQPTQSDPSGTCDLDQFGSGNGYPAETAAHEMVHSLDQPTPVRPHACFLDPAHVCDSHSDLMYNGGGFGLASEVLDAGHDDYYETPGPQFDVRTSPWLEHLDAPSVTFTISARPMGGGTVQASSSLCADQCTQARQDGSPFSIWAQPAPGFAFDAWSGACDTTETLCNATITGNTRVVAHFLRLVTVTVVVRGGGRVITSANADEIGQECRKRCSWRFPTGKPLTLIAVPRGHGHFAGWQDGGCSGSGPRCTFLVGKAAAPVAVFNPA